MPEKQKNVSNEFTLEIRYKPNPRVLDFRGTWAKAISEYMELPKWRIVDNRIDIFSEDRSFHTFVGFRNCGIMLLDSENRNYFPDRAIKLLKYLSGLEGFGDPIIVERLGVRSKFCDKFDRTFDELRDRYTSRYVAINDRARRIFGEGTSIIDVGAPFTFVDKIGNFNTMTGPMKKNQFPQFFLRNEIFPEVGIFYDIDYWVKPECELRIRQIIDKVKDFSYAIWDRYRAIYDLIMGE